MASSNNQHKKKPPPAAAASRGGRNNSSRTGMDVWLQKAGKDMAVGGQIRLKLVKGPKMHFSGDPVDPKSEKEQFPAILKFPISTVQPDFTNTPWKDGRLYQQDVPKPPDDSDEEEDEQQKHSNEQKRKRRWRYNRNQPAQRQWILQEQVDFLETMLKRREKRAKHNKPSSEQDPSIDQQQERGGSVVSSRYEGQVEHNPSQYVLFSLQQQQQQAHGSGNGNHHQHQNSHTVSIRHLPTPQGTIAFQQPASRRSLTLSEAEQAIQDQRAGLPTRILRAGGGGDNAAAAAPPPRHLGVPPKPKNTIKNRLLQKLQKTAAQDGVEEADDVMGDVAFRSRKGSSGGSARRELLASMGDGLQVSTDGVLGGANDDIFGGRQRFGKFQAVEEQQKLAAVDKTERGADGAAMADDFYTRDVKAEYDELDYDANEQFDDDDVDVGETEVQNIGGDGFRGEDEDDDDLDDEDGDADGDNVDGVEGLASVAGFKKMLARARGEVPAEAAEAPANAAEQKRSTSPKPEKKEEEGGDHLSKVMAAAEKSAQAIKDKAAAEPGTAQAAAPAAAAATKSELQVDENGLRVISLKAVQREIWLNHGSIPTNRLMKIFDAKKKHGAARQAKFGEVVKELCTMENHPVNGRTLVLKQHYSHMD